MTACGGSSFVWYFAFFDWFFNFFNFFFNRGLVGPIWVVDAEFVAADRVAGLEWISANAFFFALNAVLRVGTGEA